MHTHNRYRLYMCTSSHMHTIKQVQFYTHAYAKHICIGAQFMQCTHK